jgi:hypothetical protein
MSPADGGTESHIVVRHSTAYRFIAKPMLIEQQIWLHLPINVSLITNAPAEILQQAHRLQNICDAALIRYAQLAPMNATAQVPFLSLLRGEEVARNKTNEKRKNSEWRPTDYGYFMAGAKPKSLGDTQRICARKWSTLPPIDTQAHVYEIERAMSYLNVEEVFIDITYDSADGVQKTTDGKLPSTLEMHKEPPFCYTREGKTGTYQQCDDVSWADLDDTPNVVYTAYKKEAELLHIRAYKQPEFNEETHNNLVWYGRTADDVKALNYLRQLRPLCKLRTTPEQRRAQEVRVANEQQISTNALESLQTATQACYDSVERIEVQSVERQLGNDRAWETHNMRRGSLGLTSKSAAMATKRENRGAIGAISKQRARRGAIGAVGLLARRLLGSAATRKWGMKVLEAAAGNAFERVLPRERKGISMLQSAAQNTGTILPLMSGIAGGIAGMAGLGFNMWANYKTTQRLDTQLRMIEATRSELRQQAQSQRTIQLAAERNAENIGEMAKTIGRIIADLAAAHTSIDILAATTEVNTAVGQFSQIAVKSVLACAERIREFGNIAEQAQQGRLPNLISSAVRAEIQRYKLQGDQVAQHPDRPIHITPIIRGSQIDVFAQLVAGRSDWELYEVIPLPRFADNRAYTRQTAFQFALVDEAQKVYIPLDQQEANDCRRGVCKASGVIRHVADDPCTIIMIALGKPRDECPMSESPRIPFFKSTEAGLLYSTPDEILARLHCRRESEHARTGVDRPVRLVGSGLRTLPDGCNLELIQPEVTIVGPPRRIDANKLTSEAIAVSSSQLLTEAERSGAVKASSTLARKYKQFVAESYKTYKRKIAMALAGGAIAVGLLACISLAAMGCDCYMLNRIARLSGKRRKLKATLDTTIQSIVGFIRETRHLLADRETLRHYIRGAIVSLPVRSRLRTPAGEIELDGESPSAGRPREKASDRLPRSPRANRIVAAAAAADDGESPDDDDSARATPEDIP